MASLMNKYRNLKEEKKREYEKENGIIASGSRDSFNYNDKMETKEEIKRLRFKVKKIVSDLNRVVSELYNAELLSSPEKKEEDIHDILVKRGYYPPEKEEPNGVSTQNGLEKSKSDIKQCIFCNRAIGVLLIDLFLDKAVCSECMYLLRTEVFSYEKQETTQEFTKEELRIIRNACRVREEYADAPEYKFLCEIALKIERLLK